MTTVRPLYEIAREIKGDPAYQRAEWCAHPYVDAMGQLASIGDQYGYDDAKSVVLYALSNLLTDRGESDDSRDFRRDGPTEEQEGSEGSGRGGYRRVSGGDVRVR